jgi:hypothetical protein
MRPSLSAGRKSIAACAEKKGGHLLSRLTHPPPRHRRKKRQVLRELGSRQKYPLLNITVTSLYIAVAAECVAVHPRIEHPVVPFFSPFVFLFCVNLAPHTVLLKKVAMPGDEVLFLA